MKSQLHLSTALCSAVAFAANDAVPEWINLLPAGTIRTVDGRGPFSVASMTALIAASLPAGSKLPLDENHSTDKGGASLGMPAPARGWIVDLEAREDGLWGKVEWTGPGRQLMEDKAYAGISPVIAHSAQGEIIRVLRASLTNTPNLQGLVSLHSNDLAETETMDWKAKLIELLGLDSSADDAAIEAALSAKMMSANGKTMCAQDVLALPQVIALQTQISELSGTIATLTEGTARKDAEAFVDAAIREGRVGIKPLRDEYIALHMQDPARAAKLVGGMMKLPGTTGAADVAVEQDGNRGLGVEDQLIMSTFGVDEESYRAGLKSKGLKMEAL